MRNLVWLRRDLRTRDNPALFTAMQQGATQAIYFITPEQWDSHDCSPAQRSLIKGQLLKLSQQLTELNVPLQIIHCPYFADIPAYLERYVNEQGIQQLLFNHQYEWNEMHCTRQVVKMARSNGIAVNGLHDQCIITPGQLTNGQGGCYKVYSAFKRAFMANFLTLSRETYSLPKPQKKIGLTSDIDALHQFDVEWSWQLLWPAGEDEALDRLDHFLEQTVNQYKDNRDIPSVVGTSGLSPYLAIGAISTAQCLHAALRFNRGELDSGNQGASSWINELIWREFYRHLIVAYPDLCRHKPFKPDTDNLPWRHDKKLFAAWCEGRTGFPIVDAAMRQLVSTSWMHNRLRMITAMFLTKHLFIDWRWGERFFMQHLVDGDLASNNGGWQWSASTGVDAVPYFRIFNPTRQSRRFDPDGDFIRKFVPELSHLDSKSIHQPTVAQAISADYPLPIVDHVNAVAQTKASFKRLNEQSEAFPEFHYEH
ncbi:deoxyribodipyrimidine photo-lyase [Neptunicella sp. SCSIO 80796]|uniref:deoxyribodipyrimidine photo-lyase n=1 Tax=Neptunicella plasticusilytica TaxID=3117012 RepID=UPI003A4D9ED6